MDERTRQAIARIDIKDASRGTGALVAPGIVLTALHVVGDRNANPVTFYPGTIELTFPGHTTTAKPIEGLCDPKLDWCLLRCEESPPVRPLPISDLTQSDIEWHSYGFPDSQPIDGMVHAGTVRNHRGKLGGITAYQLFSEEAAAGNGAPVKGLSGAPVLVEGAVVGLMRFALMKDRQAVAGTLYACPVTEVVKGSGQTLPVPDPVQGLPGLPHQPLPPTPFRYLKRYTAADAEVFFGRNQETARLYRMVDDPDGAGIVLLYGRSGVGKSSFLDAGLFPRLSWNHCVRYLRRDPSVSLLDTLRNALHSAAYGDDPKGDVEDPAWQDLGPLWRAAQARQGKPVVVILDQLEEMFTHRRHGNELSELCQALEVPAPGRLILGFRKEWYPEVTKSLEQAGLDFARFFLEPLSQESVEEATGGLGRTRRLHERYRLTVEETLPAMVGHDLLADPDAPVAPTLQILLTKMWQDATAANEEAPGFTVELYVKMKQEGVLLADFLHQQLAKLRRRRPQCVDSGLALTLLGQHTTPLLTSRECAAADLARDYAHHPDYGGLMTDLRDLYLLVDAGTDSTRLAHDTLAPVVRAELEESRLLGARALRLLGHRDDWNDGAVGATLGPIDLATVEAGLPGMRAPTPDEARLLAASRRERARAVRIRRTVRIAFAVLFIAILGAGVIAWYEREAARRQTFLAELDSSTSVVSRELDAHPMFGALRAIWAAGACYEEFGDVKANLQLSLSEAVEVSREIRAWPRRQLQGTVYAIAFNPRPGVGLIATGIGQADPDDEGRQRPGSVRLWNIEGGRIGRVMRHTRGDVRAVAWAPNGDVVLSGGDDGHVRFWDANGRPQGSLALPRGPSIRALAVHRDGMRFATADTNGDVIQWDFARRERIVASIAAHEGGAFTAEYAPDGNHLVTGGRDGVVRVWTLDGKQVNEFTDHLGAVHSVDVARGLDGTVRIVSGGDDGTVRLSHLTEKATLRNNPRVFRHEDDVTCVSFSADGELIASGDLSNLVQISDLNGLGGAPPFNSPRGAVYAVAYGPTTDNYVLVGGADRRLRLRSPAGKMIGMSRYQQRNEGGVPEPGEDRLIVESVAMSPDGTRIASAGGRATPDDEAVSDATGTLCLWPNDMSGPRLHRIEIDTRITSVVFRPDNTGLIGACGDGSLRMWDMTLQAVGEPVPAGAAGQIYEVAIDGRQLASINGKDVVLWDVQAETLVKQHELKGHRLHVYAVAFSRDGRFVASGGGDQDIRLWTTADGKQHGETIDVPHCEIYGLAFGPHEGKEVLYVAGASSHLFCYDLNGKRLAALEAHAGSVRSVSVSRSGDRIATGGKDGLVKLWQLRPDKDQLWLRLLAVMRWGHSKAVDSVVMGGPRDRVVASGGEDGTTRLWRAHWRTWMELAAEGLESHPEILNAEHNQRRKTALRYCREKIWQQE